jgi:hypothetical protein
LKIELPGRAKPSTKMKQGKGEKHVLIGQRVFGSGQWKLEDFKFNTSRLPKKR